MNGRTPILNGMAKEGVAMDVTQTRRRISKAPSKPQDQIISDQNGDIDMQRRVSVTPTNIKELSTTELQEYFLMCLKMFNENKITTKNAWNVHIIQYIHKLLLSKGESPDMLQVAGMALDICAKVYALRIDDLYDQAVRLSRSLSRRLAGNGLGDEAGEQEEGRENQQGASNDQENIAETRKKNKKSRRSDAEGRHTIASNNINCELTVHELQQNTTAADSSHLMTVTLNLRPCKYSLLLHDIFSVPAWNTAAPISDMTEEPSQLKTPVRPKHLPSVRKMAAATLAPPELADLRLEGRLFNRKRRSLGGGHVMYDNEGIPIPYLDPGQEQGDDYDGVDGNDEVHWNNENDAAEAEEVAVPYNTEVVMVTDMRPTMALGNIGDLEYSYRTMPEAGIVWAGPSHWKLKCLQQNSTATLTKAAPARKRTARARNAPPTIEFDQDVLSHEQLLAECSKQKCCRRAFRKVPERCTLPENLLLPWGDMLTLEYKPLQSVVPARIQDGEKSLMADLNISCYDHDNPNDAGYSPTTFDEQGCENGAGGDSDARDADSIAASSDDDDEFAGNMVEAPHIVQKVSIPYVTQPKKIDMKKLKELMWKRIGEELKKVNPSSELNGILFSQLHKTLPSMLPDYMAEELTKSLAFSVLLHLATEHGLSLESTSKQKDIIICKD